MRLAPLAALALLCAGVDRCTAVAITDRHDAAIRTAAERWLPGWDWRWLKAQWVAESNLDPAAVSPAGARGIAQLMPATADEVARQLRVGAASPHDVAFAVEAGAFYMARMRAAWSAPRPEHERRRLAQASYNAGLGSILRAQRVCRAAASAGATCLTWGDIAPHLHRVTGRHAAETLGYVARIERIYARLTHAQPLRNGYLPVTPAVMHASAGRHRSHDVGCAWRATRGGVDETDTRHHPVGCGPAGGAVGDRRHGGLHRQLASRRRRCGSWPRRARGSRQSQLRSRAAAARGREGMRRAIGRPARGREHRVRPARRHPR